MSEWAKLGVTQVNGQALPVRGDRKGFLLMPAGRFGPAFIVTENFYVLKDYNYSDLYALYIGHLADRFATTAPSRAMGQDRRLHPRRCRSPCSSAARPRATTSATPTG